MEYSSPGGLGSLCWTESSQDGSSDEGDTAVQRLNRRLVDAASVVSIVARERGVLAEAITQQEQESITLAQLLLQREDRVS